MPTPTPPSDTATRRDRRAGSLELLVRYGIVLGLIAAIYLLAASIESAWVTPVLVALAASLVVVVAIPHHPSRHRIMMFSAVFLVATALSAALASAGQRAAGLSDLIVAAMLMFGIVVIAGVIVRSKQITAQAVVGAVDIYIMLGLVFGFAFSGIERLTDVPFFSTDMLSTRDDFLYFAFVAMTTVGFGDLTPGDNYARPLTIVTVLSGQIVLVVVVARVVAMLGESRRAAQSPGQWS